MIRFEQVDNSHEWLERCRPLFEESYAEVMEGTGIPRPDINLDALKALDAVGMTMAIVALTSENEVVGYTLSYAVPLFMYGGFVVMNNESMFVKPEHRGTTSMRLIRETEKAAAGRGASRMVWHLRPGTRAEELFRRRKYQNFDNAWSKEI
jgi:hypothetical protein